MVARTAIDRLVAGMRSFRAAYYEQRPERIRPLIESGQQPEVLLIACSDSRVDPAILMNSEPGELFVVRNVANLVPPYQADGTSRGTSSAIEFAVRDLQVKHIVVLGHSGCGGIRALMNRREDQAGAREFIGPWMRTVEEADAGSVSPSADADPSETERRAIGISLRNLMGFPWVAERVSDGRLNVRGWWFDMRAGELWQTEPGNTGYRQIALG